MRKFYEIGTILIFFFVICFIYHSQQRITLNGGKGWDGLYYYQIIEQIQAGTKPVVGVMPFIRRLGTPFLIARFSEISGMDILSSALYINLTGILITVVLLLFWLRKFFTEFWINVLLCFLFMMTWYAPVRYSFYVPLTTDSWGAVWFVGALLLLDRMRSCYNGGRLKEFMGCLFAYSLMIAVGNFFRESNGLLSILPFFILYPLPGKEIFSKKIRADRLSDFLRTLPKLIFDRRNLFILIPILFVITSNLLVTKRISISDLNVYSYSENILTFLYTKTLPEFILGILNAFGPLILLIPLYFKRIKSLLWERPEVLILLVMSIAFGFIGGTDTERILFMTGFPVIFILLGISIRELYYSSQRWWLYVLFLLQTISMRYYWNLPDFSIPSGHTPVPFFGLMSSHVKYLYLYSHWSNYLVNTIILAEYFILFMVTWYIIRHRVVFKSQSVIAK